MPTSDSTVRAALSALAERARAKLEHREKVLAEWPDARPRLEKMERANPPRILPEPEPTPERPPRAPRERVRSPRARVLESLGGGDRCEVCGDTFPAQMWTDTRCVDHRHDNDVIRGVVCRRCNRDLAVLDLRFTDPDRFAALSAFSLRSQPAVPTKRKRSRVKKMSSEPKLFGE